MKKYLLITTIILFSPFFAIAESVEQLNADGVRYSDNKMYDDAMESFKKAITIQDAQAARAFHNRGWVLEMQGNIPAALENYKEAVRRNPNLADSYERIGYWYYKAGKYADAVAMGEKVLKIDPSNADVKKWIADAYKLRMDKPGVSADLALIEQKPSPTAEEPKKEDPALAEKKPDELKKDELKKNTPKEKIIATLDFTLRGGYYYDDNKYDYVHTDGVIMNLPYNFALHMMPFETSNTRFSFMMGNAYVGSALTGIIGQYEKTEGVIAIGPFGLGAGMQINHYKGDDIYGENKSLIDVKPGLIIEYSDKKSQMSIWVYPRYVPLFYDNKSSTGKTMDVSNGEMLYKYTLDEVIGYYSRVSFGDYYFFDHDLNVLAYSGYYDIALGLNLGNKGAVFGRDLNVSIEIGKRVYLMKIAVDDRYKVMNGTSFMGIDRSGGKHDLFKGYNGVSNLFNLTATESITQNVFIYQKVMIEFVDRHNDHNEFALQLGVGGKI